VTRNVALVVLDTVRKDYFDDHAPRLQDAADCTFEQCRAASSWSVPSHVSLFTGELPSEHGVHAESFGADFDFGALAGERFLADLDDWRQVGLSANSYVNAHFGADELFDAFQDFSIGSHPAESLFTEGKTVDEYIHRTDEGGAIRRHLGYLAECLRHDHPVKSLANGAWAKIGPRAKHWPIPELVDDGAGVITETATRAAEDGDEPTFFFLNYMDAHRPLRNLVQHDRGRHDVPDSWSSTQIDKWELNREDAATPEYTENYRAVYGAAKHEDVRPLPSSRPELPLGAVLRDNLAWTDRRDVYDDYDLDERLFPEHREVHGLPARQKLCVNDVRWWLS